MREKYEDSEGERTNQSIFHAFEAWNTANSDLSAIPSNVKRLLECDRVPAYNYRCVQN